MSEFRQDITSGDWVIIAPGRAKRPDQLMAKLTTRKPAPKKTCPFEFEHLRSSGQWPPLFPDSVNAETEILVIPNKYPAISRLAAPVTNDPHGLYRRKAGVGEHELVITRNHLKSFADIGGRTAGDVFEVFQGRHKALAKDPRIAYISTFFNWGSSAGASVWHPHYQILGIPIVPPHVMASLHGSEMYFKKNGRCVRCDVIKAERKNKKRVVAENAYAIAFTPYASKHPFEVSIFPRKHASSFSRTPVPAVRGVAQLLQGVLRRLKRNLHDPDYNVFIHGAALDYQKYPYHHWHVEILPKTTMLAGFEFATDIDINIIDPDEAAKILRR